MIDDLLWDDDSKFFCLFCFLLLKIQIVIRCYVIVNCMFIYNAFNFFYPDELYSFVEEVLDSDSNVKAGQYSCRKIIRNIVRFVDVVFLLLVF